MRINQKLNLVQPIETDAGTLYLHSMPISRAVWETYYLVLSKTYAAILSEGLNIIAGPPIARMILKDIAVSTNRWEGDAGVEQGLLAEMRRLTNVLVPAEGAWQLVPYEEVLRRGTIDEDSLADAEGALVFFTCVSAVLRSPSSRTKMTTLIGGLESVWGAQTTPLDAMAFGVSLKTSTEDALLAKPMTSLVPH